MDLKISIPEILMANPGIFFYNYNKLIKIGLKL
jgi:hypothetical protein